MHIEFHLKSDELNEIFLELIKSQFRGKKIAVYIDSENDDPEQGPMQQDLHEQENKVSEMED